MAALEFNINSTPCSLRSDAQTSKAVVDTHQPDANDEQYRDNDPADDDRTNYESRH